MNNFFSILNKIFPLSANAALNIIMRLIIVSMITNIHPNYKECGSHILVILGILNLTYFFSIGSSIRTKIYEHEKNKEDLLLTTLLSSLTLSMGIGLVTSLFSYFAIHPILTLFAQPTNVIEYTTYFFKCFSFCIIPNALFQSLQQIYIGLNHSYIVIIVNLFSSLGTLLSLYLLIKCSILINPLDIKFAYPFLFYGLFGIVILFFILHKKFRFHYNQMVKSFTYITEMKTLFKISMPFCVQNIHGNFVHFSHILVIGMLVPHLLTAYHIFMQYNLIIFIVILGGVQAFGLDSLHPILKRNYNELIYKTKNFIKVFLFILTLIGIFYFIKILNHINIHHYFIMNRYDLWISYGIAFIAFIIFLVRNSLIISLTNLGDPILPAMTATVMSIGVGLPLSMYLSHIIMYPIVGLHLGIIIHYTLTTVILSFRFKNKWKIYSII